MLTIDQDELDEAMKRNTDQAKKGGLGRFQLLH